MIDEKKLIEVLKKKDDRMDFEVPLKALTIPEVTKTVQAIVDKLLEGFVNLINAQPRIGFTSVKEGYPTKAREYLCRCNIDGYDEFPFYMVLRYYLIDENPHFQHETAHGLHVTHWMAFEPPKDGGGA